MFLQGPYKDLKGPYKVLSSLQGSDPYNALLGPRYSIGWICLACSVKCVSVSYRFDRFLLSELSGKWRNTCQNARALIPPKLDYAAPGNKDLKRTL